MREPLFRVVKDFLSSEWVFGTPVLIGLSGGVDSCALFSLLLECRRFFSLDLRVAHFDHGWREESAQEAQILKKRVEDLGIRFYSRRAKISKGDFAYSNLEEKAREERYLFFKEVYLDTNSQALILAHQKEDLVETVLKRIFEGAALFSLFGMEPSSYFEEMKVWRPLLSVSRKELIAWNEKKGLAPFLDRTNFDLKFLRPRMREDLIPYLEKSFGKSIQDPLVRISEESAFYKKEVEARITPYLERKIETPFVSFLPLMDLKELNRIEKRELVRLFLQNLGVVLSRRSLTQALVFLEERSLSKEINVSSGKLFLDRGSLFWFKEDPPIYEQSSLNGWLWEKKENVERKVRPLLLSFLKGELFYKVPRDKRYLLSSYDALSLKEQKSVSSYLSRNKIPCNMRKMFPFLIVDSCLFDVNLCFGFKGELTSGDLFLSIILKKTSN